MKKDYSKDIFYKDFYIPFNSKNSVFDYDSLLKAFKPPVPFDVRTLPTVQENEVAGIKTVLALCEKFHGAQKKNPGLSKYEIHYPWTSGRPVRSCQSDCALILGILGWKVTFTDYVMTVTAE
jgi:hypothetical protein